MAEGVLYADLNLPSASISVRQLHPAQKFNASQAGSRWHQIVLWSGWAGTVILLVTVIVLDGQTAPESKNDFREVFKVFQGSLCKGDISVCLNNDTEEEARCLQGPPGSAAYSENITFLKDSLCGPATGSSECKICPMNWVAEKGKCYWFSKEKRNWSEAHDNCARKQAQMLVIQDKEEQEFIQSRIQGRSHFWIGLHIAPSRDKWIWVNNSPLDQALSVPPTSTNAAYCGAFKSGKIRFEICKDEFEWVCEDDAVLI